jgi:hypothetical protein
MLMALLGEFPKSPPVILLSQTNVGEMHFVPSSSESWFNLPRDYGVAYAAQESWVQNATIRDNILFGAPYNEERYQKGMRALSSLGRRLAF